MTRTNLISKIFQKQTFLCVGLDTDLTKIPKHLLNTDDPIFEFNKAIIDATHRYAIAYKPNLAFYESAGIKGMQALKKTADYLKNFDVFTIADAKRGDIGNTSAHYAKAFLSPDGDFNFDAITVAPYMGEDSVTPFFAYPEKWVVLLALTSTGVEKNGRLPKKLRCFYDCRCQTWRHRQHIRTLCESVFESRWRF